jgi:hypothetical protein
MFYLTRPVGRDEDLRYNYCNNSERWFKCINEIIIALNYQVGKLTRQLAHDLHVDCSNEAWFLRGILLHSIITPRIMTLTEKRLTGGSLAVN